MTIDIGPLDDADAAALAVSAGATDERAILRAEGNPLFVIELARSHASEPDDIPVTVHGAIGARLDELPIADRELLQRAAVAGEMFDVRDAAPYTRGHFGFRTTYSHVEIRNFRVYRLARAQ